MTVHAAMLAFHAYYIDFLMEKHTITVGCRLEYSIIANMTDNTKRKTLAGTLCDYGISEAAENT